MLNLELKCRGAADDVRRLALAAAAAVAQRGATDKVVFSSFDMPTLERLREASPLAQIGVLWQNAPFDAAWRHAAELGAIAIHPRADTVTPEFVRAARDRGLETYVWTVNSVDQIVELVQAGVDGVMSDYPGRLLEARARLLGDREQTTS
jgi:glycerophosphoryl diester phosphodiesterase